MDPLVGAFIRMTRDAGPEIATGRAGMPRFAISHHTGHPEKADHYDIMLESGEALKTWSVSALDATTAQRIQDHRMMYLDYEGEVSGGRGEVRIVDRGTYDVLEWSAHEISVRLRGNRYYGELRLQEQGPVWRVAQWPKPLE